MYFLTHQQRHYPTPTRGLWVFVSPYTVCRDRDFMGYLKPRQRSLIERDSKAYSNRILLVSHIDRVLALKAIAELGDVIASGYEVRNERMVAEYLLIAIVNEVQGGVNLMPRKNLISHEWKSPRLGVRIRLVERVRGSYYLARFSR